MASNIKGITIEIGGNTAPLDKALKDVNKTTRDLQSELKEVNKQLKLDPTNTVLLTQKQKLLSESITSTKEKLETLKGAEKQAQEQFKLGKISEEQYRALQREIIKTESQLKELTNQAGKSNAAISKISNITDDVGKATTKMGKNLLPVTAGVVALGAASVAAFDQVDSGSDIIIKKTGATGQAAKDLDAIYKDLATSVPDSFDEIGSAVGEINTRLEFTGEKLRTSSEDFLKFSKINNIDVNTSVQLVSRAMGDAGIKADDYKSVLDMLTVASQKSGISIENLTTNLAKYGAPMRALGFDTSTSIALFSGWEKAGVNTEVAFSGMKKAISNWSEQGKDSRKEFAKTIAEIKKCPDIATATTKAIEVFGAKAGPDLADAIKGGRFEVNQYIDALNNAGGAVNNTYDGIVDSMDDGKTAMNAAKVASAELGSSILTMLGPILKDLAGKAREVAKMFSGMDDSTRKTIMTVLEVIAVIAPILIIAGKIASGISTVSKAMAMLKTATMAQTIAQHGLNAALLANPITWIILAIVALIGGIVLLYNKCEWFRNFVNGMMSFIAERVKKAIPFFMGIFNALKPIFMAIFNILVGVFKLAWAIIKPIFDLLVGIIKIVVGIIKAVWGPLVSIVSIPFKIAWGIIKGIFDSIVSHVKAFIGIVAPIFSAIFNILKVPFEKAWEIIKGIFNFFVDLIHSSIEKVKAVFSKVGEIIIAPFKWAWEKISGIVTTIKDALGNLFKGIKIPKIDVQVKWGGPGDAIPYPSFDVKWNAAGGILTKPTIFGQLGSQLLGGGEAGDEGIIPLKELWKQLSINFDKLEARLVNTQLVLLNRIEALVSKLGGNQLAAEGNTIINFNGSYSFGSQNDIEHFMNKAGQLVRRKRE